MGQSTAVLFVWYIETLKLLAAGRMTSVEVAEECRNLIPHIPTVERRQRLQELCEELDEWAKMSSASIAFERSQKAGQQWDQGDNIIPPRDF